MRHVGVEIFNRRLIRHRPLIRFVWGALVILLAACDADGGGGGY